MALDRETMQSMTLTPPGTAADWLRHLDRATTAHEKTRKSLEIVIADARQADVPLTTIAKHTPWSREWCRKIADRIDAERAANS